MTDHDDDYDLSVDLAAASRRLIAQRQRAEAAEWMLRRSIARQQGHTLGRGEYYWDADCKAQLAELAAEYDAEREGTP